MSHNAAHIIIDSLLDIFDPANPEYAGTRDHFSTSELAKIDEIRGRDPQAGLNFLEKVFCSYVIDKAIFTGD